MELQFLNLSGRFYGLFFEKIIVNYLMSDLTAKSAKVNRQVRKGCFYFARPTCRITIAYSMTSFLSE